MRTGDSGGRAEYRYEIRLSQDGKYGSPGQGRGGGWNGMMGMLQAQQADLIAADLTMSVPRAQDVDFSTPFLTQPLKMLVRRSSVDGSAFSSRILDPFTWDTWLVLLLAFIVSGAFLWFVVSRN